LSYELSTWMWDNSVAPVTRWVVPIWMSSIRSPHTLLSAGCYKTNILFPSCLNTCNRIPFPVTYTFLSSKNYLPAIILAE